MLNAGDERERRNVAEALASIGVDSREAVPVLVQALQDRNLFVRMNAVKALLGMGPAAKDAVPALEKVLNDQNASVRRLAEMALEKIREPAGEE